MQAIKTQLVEVVDSQEDLKWQKSIRQEILNVLGAKRSELQRRIETTDDCYTDENGEVAGPMRTLAAHEHYIAEALALIEELDAQY